MENYARKWFALDDTIQQDQRNALAESFLRDSEYVQDLRVNPLMLSLMCGLYSGERYIPKNRPDVYEKCAMLLFERWDKQRGIVAPLPFDAHVMSSMRSLALWLYPQQAQSTGLPRHELVEFMADYLHKKRFDDADDAEDAANSFIDFCRGRAWVLTDVGSERYWFTHQTFLEFFAAAQIVREHPSALGLLEMLRPRIMAAEWDVVAQLAVQSLGRTVEDGADDFLAELIRETSEIQGDEAKRFRVNSLSFAARALSFVVPRPEVVRSIVIACVDLASEPDHAGSDRASSNLMPITELMDGTPENHALTRKYLLESVKRVIDANPADERALTLALFWSSFRRRVFRGVPSRTKQRSADDIRLTIELFRENEQVLTAAATSLSWVAAYFAEDGRTSVQDVVDRFGMQAFYECHFGGQVIDPPIVWKIANLHPGNAYPWANPKGKEFGIDLLRQVYRAAVDAQGPWLPADPRRFSPLLDMNLDVQLRRDPNEADQLALSCGVLMLLPIVELRLLDGRKGKSLPTERAIFLADRLRPGSTKHRQREKADRGRDHSAAERFLADLPLLSDARVIVNRWCRKDVSFVSS